MNGRALIKAIAGKRVDAGVAIEKMRLAYALRQYAERLRNFAAVMDSASTRINLAVRWREDYEVVAEAARARITEAAPEPAAAP